MMLPFLNRYRPAQPTPLAINIAASLRDHPKQWTLGTCYATRGDTALFVGLGASGLLLDGARPDRASRAHLWAAYQDALTGRLRTCITAPDPVRGFVVVPPDGKFELHMGAPTEYEARTRFLHFHNAPRDRGEQWAALVEAGYRVLPVTAALDVPACERRVADATFVAEGVS